MFEQMLQTQSIPVYWSYRWTHHAGFAHHHDTLNSEVSSNRRCFYIPDDATDSKLITPDIDLKTVCATGSCGLLNVAPSAGKVWLRPIFSVDIPDIPHDMARDLAGMYHVGQAKPLQQSEEDLLHRQECSQPAEEGPITREQALSQNMHAVSFAYERCFPLFTEVKDAQRCCRLIEKMSLLVWLHLGSTTLAG